MSYEDGWAAVNLQTPPRVPRTEYSAHMHWELVQTVTGIDVTPDSDPAEQQEASKAFVKAWNYDFMWNILISRGEFGEYYTDMGHAEYAAGGVDKRDIGESAFKTPEDVLSFDPMEALGVIDKAETVRRFEENYKLQGTLKNSLFGLAGLFAPWRHRKKRRNMSPYAPFFALCQKAKILRDIRI